LIAYGENEPFAVDAAGRPYCRVHGPLIEAAYEAESTRYRAELKDRRRQALQDLDEATSASAPGE
jgi:hypothetical protein